MGQGTEQPKDWRPETALGIDAVGRALALASSRAGAADVSIKGGRDVVTATDGAIEDAVRSLLANELDAAVIGEERGGEAGAGSYWIVDPICGTRNYASGIPLYCINLALVERNEVTVAIVGDASNAELLVAEAGAGAWALEDGAPRRISTSATSQTLVIEDSHASGHRRERAALFAADAIRADRWDLRSLSTTLSLAYVASGRVAGYVLFWTSAIHSAAGSLLAAEAGATVSDLDGHAWTVDSDSIVASANPELHDDLLDRLRTASAYATSSATSA